MKYRKKPVEIEAMQLTKDNTTEVLTFCNANDIVASNDDGTISIRTLEGTMTASIGDYIIKGVKGEYYPCKPDIFEATYDPVIECVCNVAPFISPQDGSYLVDFSVPIAGLVEWLHEDPQVISVEVDATAGCLVFEILYNQKIINCPGLVSAKLLVYNGTTIVRENGIYRTEHNDEQ